MVLTKRSSNHSSHNGFGNDSAHTTAAVAVAVHVTRAGGAPFDFNGACQNLPDSVLQR
jgi:hypothetical protein